MTVIHIYGHRHSKKQSETTIDSNILHIASQTKWESILEKPNDFVIIFCYLKNDKSLRNISSNNWLEFWV